MTLDITDGPDWLDLQADRLAGQNHDAEAAQARRLAQEWNADRNALDRLQDENTDLQRRNSELQRRLDNTLRAAQGTTA